MTAEPVRFARRILPLLALAVLSAVALAVRLAVLDVPGHTGDVSVVAGWAERLAEVGPLRFYENSASIYPALLYLYWPMGVVLDGEALDLAIKGLSIPFDLALGGFLYLVVAPRAGGWAGVGAAALYLLNPAVILAGPVWGQIDAAGTLVFVAAMVAAGTGRHAAAGALAMIAALVKPQFGLALLPVAVLVIVEWRRTRRLRPLLRAGAATLVAYLVVIVPLLLDPIRHLSNVRTVTDIRPEASVLAPNPWALLVGYEVPDAPYAGLGAALLVAGLAASLLPLRWRRNLPALLAVGTFIVLAFYFLPTRVHERYLFPAMGVLAPLAAVSLPVLGAYLVLSAGFALSLLYALVDTTPFTLPLEWEEILVSEPMLWGMGLMLIGSAVTLVVQLSLGAGHRLADARGSPQPGG